LRLAFFRLFDRGLAGLVFRVQCDGSIKPAYSRRFVLKRRALFFETW
jgi:hypothetical protein